MTRLTEKLRLSSLLYKPTRFLALVSLSTLHLCKSLLRSLLSQTLPPFLAMDNLFADSFSDDFDSSYSLRPHRRSLQEDDRDFADERVYLIPYRYYLTHSLTHSLYQSIIVNVSLLVYVFASRVFFIVSVFWGFFLWCGFLAAVSYKTWPN